MANLYFFIIGTSLFLLALTLTISRLKLRFSAERVKGVVIDHAIRNKAGIATSGDRCAQICYVLKGETKNFSDHNNAVSRFYRKNQQIELLIDKHNPNRIMVNSFFALFSPSLALLFFSVLLLCMASR